MTQAIRGFSGEYRFLSNFWESPLTFRGITYPTSEHAYQAAKFSDAEHKNAILTAPTPGKAKRLGNTPDYPIVSNWSEVSTAVMAEIQVAKYENDELRHKLLSTGDAYIEETNTWGDNTWGNDPSTPEVGQNRLGVILMTIRAAFQIREEQKSYALGAKEDTP